MLRGTLKYLTRTIWLLVALGCGDPVRTTVQLVRLRLVDSTSNEPIVGVRLMLKVDFEADESPDDEQLPRDEWERRKFIWDQAPWFHGVTDEDGKADIVVEYTVLDRSWGKKVPAWRDWVNGKPYIVRVKRGQVPDVLTKFGESPEDRATVVMEPGEFAKARTVTVSVLEIQEPRYVATK